MTTDKKVPMDEVRIKGTSLKALMEAYDNYINQAFCKEMLSKTANPQQQKSIILDTLIFKQVCQNLKGDEKLPFTYQEAYFEAEIPKEFLQ